MRLQAAINGRRGRLEHPAVPVTAIQIGADAGRAAAAGVEAIHFHVREHGGAESLDADDVDRTMVVVRAAAPGIAIGISTGAWIEPDPRKRLEVVREWTRIPDFASVNYHEHGADDLARLLLARGIGVEVGLWDGGAAQRLVREGIGRRCLRVVIEPMEEELEGAVETVREIEGVLDAAGLLVPRLLHGAGPTTWPLLSLAVERGYAGRIGLEDTLEMPDGTPAPDNAALIRAAGELLARGGSEP